MESVKSLEVDKMNLLHMTRQVDFVVGQATLRVRCPKGADTIHEETIALDGCLKALFTIPGHAARAYSQSVK